MVIARSGVEAIVPIDGFAIADTLTLTEADDWAVEGTAGRAKMAPDGSFAFTAAADELRPHYEGGAIAGYYLQPAAAYVGPDAQATSLTGAEAITDVGGTSGGTPVPAGSNSEPDRFGGTGDCLLIPQRTGASAQRQWRGATVDVVSGDLVRVSAKFHLASDPSAGATLRLPYLRALSGTVPPGFCTVAFDADGVIDPGSVSPSNNPIRYGLEPLETVGGKQVWLWWIEMLAPGTATVHPLYLEANAAVGMDIAWHDCPLMEKNPTAPPNPLPIGGTATYAADRFDFGDADAFYEVDFWRIARTHSRLAGDAIAVPNPAVEGNRPAISGPVWPYENRIDLLPASEATGHAGILPCANSLLDVSQIAGFRSPAVRAKGYFGDTIVSSAGTASPIDIRGLSATNFHKMPWMSFDTSRAHVSTLRFDGVIAKLTSEFETQFGQTEVAANIINRVGFDSSFRMDVGGFVAHPYTHGRLRKRNPFGSEASSRSCMYVGSNNFDCNAASIKLHNAFAHGVARHIEMDSGSVSNTITLDLDTVLLERFSSDGIYFGRGDFTGTVNNLVIADDAFVELHFFQTAPDLPIFIDVGGGWVSVPDRATALSQTVGEVIASLPLDRQFTYYGAMDQAWQSGVTRTIASNLVVDERPTWTTAVPQYEQDTPAAVVSDDTPGFQFHATDAELGGDHTRANLPYDSAWISRGSGAASATNPHILVIRGNGRYNVSTGVWQEDGDAFEAPVLTESGTHPDATQKNSTNTRFNDLTFDGVVMRGRFQGFWGQGGNLAAEGVFGTEIRNALVAVARTNAVRLDLQWSGSDLTCENVFIGYSLQRRRFNNGSIANPVFQTNQNTMTLTNCTVLAQQTVDGTGEVSDGVTENPGTITGTPQIVRAPNVSFDTFTTATAVGETKPILSQMVNETALDRGFFSIDSELSEWAFTSFGQTFLGWNPGTVLDAVFNAAVDFRAIGSFVQETLHKTPDGHGQIANTASVGDEVAIYEDFDGAQSQVLLLPGHTIDPFWDGYGVDPYFRIAADGRIYVRRSIAGMDRFHRILTRTPSGEFGPIVTIDVVAP